MEWGCRFSKELSIHIKRQTLGNLGISQYAIRISYKPPKGSKWKIKGLKITYKATKDVNIQLNFYWNISAVGGKFLFFILVKNPSSKILTITRKDTDYYYLKKKICIFLRWNRMRPSLTLYLYQPSMNIHFGQSKLVVLSLITILVTRNVFDNIHHF